MCLRCIIIHSSEPYRLQIHHLVSGALFYESALKVIEMVITEEKYTLYIKTDITI